LAQSGHFRSPVSAPSESGAWNHHLQRTRPQGSRQQLRPQPPPQPGPIAQLPPQPGPPPQPPRQRSWPQRSRQQRRPHCTSVILSTPAVAAAGSGRIGAAWVVPVPPAKTRAAIPAANSMRNIVFTRFSLVDRLVIEVLERRKRLINSRTGPAVPCTCRSGEQNGHCHLTGGRASPVPEWTIPYYDDG
jgi:hypothetical protein